MADKYEMKEYVSQLVGSEYVVPTLGIYDRFEDIDFSILLSECKVLNHCLAGQTILTGRF